MLGHDVDLVRVSMQAGAALVVAIGLIVALGLSLQADLRLRRWYVPAIGVLLSLVPAIGVLMSGRDVTAAINFEVQVEPPQAMVWFLRLSSLTLVGLSLVRIGAALLSRERTAPGPVTLLTAFLAYFACNYLLNAVFGTEPSLPIVPSVYAALVLCAVYVSRDVDPHATLVAVKVSLLAVMIGSLLPLGFEPGIVRQVETAEVRIAAVGFRLFGLGSNPNAIATLALVSLLLTLHRPLRSVLFESLNLLVSGTVLVLAQSQTSWLATLIAVPVLLVGRSSARLLDKRVLIGLCMAVMLAAVGVMGLALFAKHGLTLSDFFTGDRYREVTSLTGRAGIWRAALLEWEEGPLFGFGPTMWDATYRARIGMAWAFTAHNQYLQSLAVAGAVGLCATLAYLSALGWYCFTAPRAVRGFALALYAQILARSITEVPLDIGTPFAMEFMPHFLLFFVLATARVPAAAAARASAGDPVPGTMRDGGVGSAAAMRH
jgi:O-antigen ligase